MQKDNSKIHGRPKQISGNTTKLDKKTDVVSTYSTLTVTNYQKQGEAPPKLAERDVASSKHFVEENKK